MAASRNCRSSAAWPSQSSRASSATAMLMTAAANLRVTRVLAISDGGQGGYMPQMADMEARIAAPPTVVPQAAPPVMAGTNMNIVTVRVDFALAAKRSEEHTSELQSLMRNSYAVFCLKKKTQLINDKQR